jgi:hypothetical protein
VTDTGEAGITFGIYPGSAIGDPNLTGPHDRPDRINQALDQLQGRPGRRFIVRAYELYADAGDTSHATTFQTPAGYDRYLGRGRALDLVAQYHSRSGDVDGYCAFIETLVERHGPRLATLQVAEEPNVTGDPNLDGAYPRITEALVAGVRAARAAARRFGHTDLKIGCNTSPLIGPEAGFLAELTQAGGPEFIAGLDYIGLDFFPDVFRPIAPGRLPAIVEGLLAEHRQSNLAAAGLGHLPLVITEHGWPTGPDRPAERQAEVLRTVIGVVAANARRLNITSYIHHTLRDACTNGHGIFARFGLMTDDYTPKIAFGAYRELIDAYSA